jgi:DNA modification methylase
MPKMTVVLHLGDCLEILPQITDESIDAIICDPPYPCIDRPYGRMTEAGWHEMMRRVIAESRRILKPSGSAVFILQPNCRKVGSMRPWLFEFQAWVCREWNLIQDAYWWNTAHIPEALSIQGRLLRPAIRACVWLGEPECYRDQTAILWSESEQNKAGRLEARCERQEYIAGWRSNSKPRFVNGRRLSGAAEKAGGVLPFNVIPMGNGSGTNKAGENGHPAGTPFNLMDWWARYICPPNGTLCDPFMGSGTAGLVAVKHSLNFIGIESDSAYFTIAERRITAAREEAACLLF